MGTIVKIKDGDIEKLQVALKKKLNEAMKDTSTLVEIGLYLKNNIIGEARLGRGFKRKSSRTVDDAGDPQTPLKRLEKPTIERRKEIAKRNQIGTSFDANKSNLTLSGQTLNSISFEASNTKPVLKITADGSHSGYLQKNGKRTKPVLFRDILKWQADKGRNIFGISGRMYSSILKIIKSGIRRNLK